MRELTADTIIRVKASRPPLTGDTRIRLRQIKDLADWVKDKHDNARPGEVRRWADGKLHQKTQHGWRVVPNSQDYELKEHKEPKTRKKVSKEITTQRDFDDFVEKLYNGDYEHAPTTIHLPNMNKGLLKTLGIDDNTQFIFKSNYYHISPERKAKEKQELTKEEYKKIPEAIRKAKTAYFDKQNHNFFITFEDEADPEKMNKVVFNKTKSGNYLVTLGKVNKKEGIDKTKNLLARGRS